MFGAALKLKGTEEFLDCIYNYSEMNSYGDEFAGKVYKIAEDKGQRLTYLKVTGGTLKVKEILQSPKNKEQEKVQQIRIYSGEKFTAIQEATAGTICAITGITFTSSGDGLGVSTIQVYRYCNRYLHTKSICQVKLMPILHCKK